MEKKNRPGVAAVGESVGVEVMVVGGAERRWSSEVFWSRISR